MLATQYTMNIGTPAADVVFDINSRATTGTDYSSPSPTSDLGGKRTLLVRHSATKGGVRKSNIVLTFPVLNAATGLYDSFVSGSFVLNRRPHHPLATAGLVMEGLAELCANSTFRAAILNEEL